MSKKSPAQLEHEIAQTLRDGGKLASRPSPLATHVQVFPGGGRIEYKPSSGGGGYASLTYNSDGTRYGEWIFSDRYLPRNAVPITDEMRKS